MKALLKWLGRTVGSALTLVLVIVLLPHASRLMNSVLPDLSGAAVTASATLARNLQQSARLETTLVEEEGVLESSTDALFLGQVQQVTVRYTYRASLGIDLSRVQVKVTGNTITLDPNGGELGGSVNTATINAEGKLNSLPAEPTKNFHTFIGWFTEQNGGTKVDTTTDLSNVDTIYAQWINTSENVKQITDISLEKKVGGAKGTYVFNGYNLSDKDKELGYN